MRGRQLLLAKVRMQIGRIGIFKVSNWVSNWGGIAVSIGIEIGIIFGILLYQICRGLIFRVRLTPLGSNFHYDNAFTYRVY